MGEGYEKLRRADERATHLYMLVTQRAGPSAICCLRCMSPLRPIGVKVASA